MFRAAMIDPMSPKPLPLPLPLPLPGSFAASALKISRSFLALLQAARCSTQAAVWHAALQYFTVPQPEHVFSATPVWWHMSHSIDSS